MINKESKINIWMENLKQLGYKQKLFVRVLYWYALQKNSLIEK